MALSPFSPTVLSQKVCVFRLLLRPKPTTFNSLNYPTMATTPPMPEHLPGFEIPTKHKEAMRQLHKFAKILVEALIA
jgi:hypothetical protein